jgi:glycosyltransferase involved in cell wall biosynthesis
VSARVAFFLPSFRGGGAERVMTTLAMRFAARGVDCDILVAQREGPNLPAPAAGLHVVDLRAKRVVAALAGLARYLREQSPRALLSALPHANVVALWARALARVPTRVVVSEHTMPKLSASHSEQLRARVLPVFMRNAYPKADAIVAVSEGVARDLAELVRLPRERITRIYNPVVTPELRRLAEEPLEHAWFVEGQPPVVLGAGRLVPAKDFACLLHAFAALRARRQARLMILGEGSERPQLEQLAESLGIAADIELPGFVANPYRYMKRAGVFASASRWEGLGNALIEAMACGARVVATDCPSGPREILEDGRHGQLVPVGDAAALARALAAALDGPPAPSAIERADSFSDAAALDRYSEVLGL